VGQFMRKIGRFLLHPITLSVIGLILLSLLIWYAGPLIKFGEENKAPLASATVRLLCIMGLMILWGLNNLRIRLAASKSNQDLVSGLQDNQEQLQQNAQEGQSEEELDQLNQRFTEALTTLKKLKFSNKGSKKALYELPWYIIIGPPGSGKTTALVNSGLEFPLADQFGKGALQGVGGTRNCDWWFTNSAVLIDTAGRYTTQDSHRVMDSSAWEGFLQLLKRNRRRRPINGALVAISLQDMMIQTEQERIQHAKTIRLRIDELMEKLEIRFPIYLMFTKADLVPGFREFFEDLGREEREQVWGVSLPDSTQKMDGPDFNFFGDALSKLIHRLYERLLSRVHSERTLNRRGNIYDFPTQMESLQEVVNSFVRQTFTQNRFKFQPYLRGVYFSSATQDGTPIDRMMSSVSAEYGFSPQSSQSPNQQGRSYFLSRLFEEVIFPESELVGSNARYERFVRWARRGAMAGMTLAATALIWVWTSSVMEHKRAIEESQELALNFEQNLADMPLNSRDIRAVLEPLNTLRIAVSVFDTERSPWLASIGLYDARVEDQVQESYELYLQDLFLPRLVALLEKELDKGEDGRDLYNTFRLYMMLSKIDKLDKALLSAWFEDLWSVQYPGEATRRSELKGHLRALMALEFGALELKQHIVDRTRATLLRRPVASRVYARVKANPAYMQRIYLPDLLGPSASEVFEINSGNKKHLSVPVLFTIDGYREIDFSGGSKLITEVENERWVLDDDNTKRVDFVKDDFDDLSEDLKALYYQDYAEVWLKVNDQLNVRRFRNLAHASEVLQSVTDPIYSPLRNVLHLVTDNTQLSPPAADTAANVAEKAQRFGTGSVSRYARYAKLAANNRKLTSVDKRFRELHLLMMENDTGEAPFDVWRDRIEKVHEFVADIAMAADPGQRAYEIAKERNQSGNANPIATLQNYAKSAPEPLRGWLQDLSDETWRVVMGSASQYVNNQWRNLIYAPYEASLAGRYPLDRRAKEELALYDFVEYFKPQGSVDTFFKEFVEPFVNTSKGWRNRVVDKHSMGFSHKAVQQLRRALEVKSVYFKKASEDPTLSLELKPHSLGEQDARFTLDVADTRLSYNHGPKFWKDISWSGSDEDNRIRVAIEDLDGRVHESAYSGPWAWFRLMDASKIKSTSKSNVYLITMFAGEGDTRRSAVYECKTRSVNYPLGSRLLSSFKISETLL